MVVWVLKVAGKWSAKAEAHLAQAACGSQAPAQQGLLLFLSLFIKRISGTEKDHESRESHE